MRKADKWLIVVALVARLIAVGLAAIAGAIAERHGVVEVLGEQVHNALSFRSSEAQEVLLPPR